MNLFLSYTLFNGLTLSFLDKKTGVFIDNNKAIGLVSFVDNKWKFETSNDDIYKLENLIFNFYYLLNERDLEFLEETIQSFEQKKIQEIKQNLLQ